MAKHWYMVAVVKDENGIALPPDLKKKKSFPMRLGQRHLKSGDWAKVGEYDDDAPEVAPKADFKEKK